MSQDIKSSKNPAQEKLQINVLLEGPDAKRFLDYKNNRKLRANAELGRQLMLERLDEIEAAASAA